MLSDWGGWAIQGSLPERVSDPNLTPRNRMLSLLTEDLDALLAAVSQGNPSGIQSVIENEAVDLFARTAALRAMLLLVKLGEQRREDVLDYFGSLLRGKL